MRKIALMRLAMVCLGTAALSACSYLPSGFGTASTPAAAPPEQTHAEMMAGECTAAGYATGTVAYDLCVANGTGLD